MRKDFSIMKKLLFTSFMLIMLSSCSSVADKAKLYFHTKSAKGVEPYESFMVRMRKDQELRDIMYGRVKSGRLVQCTILRNQLYVAALKGSVSHEIIEAVKVMEAAYQENDAVFLTVCEQVAATETGRIFLQVQQEYRASTSN